MNIVTFSRLLEKRIREGPKPLAAIRREGDFERKYLVEPAWEIHLAHPEITLCVHPSEPRTQCVGGCSHAAAHSNRAKGCPKCWADSKEWSVVKAYGLRHTFDLVARDEAGDTLAVEAKWLAFTGRKGPNGGFQRFVGQCALAAARHKVVLGVCGIRGRRDTRFNEHEKAVVRKLAAIDVRLIVLDAE